jgi:LemA protein
MSSPYGRFSGVIGLIVAAALVVAIAAFVWLTYNRLVAKRQATENSWAQIDVALKRRHDLIPNLVEAVKGYATHERTTFENVAEARSTAMTAEGPAGRAVAEGELARETRALLGVAEAYPELEASRNFSQLQGDLREAEDQIAITRRVYNDTVETYNTAIQVFPALVVARLFGFAKREFFDAPAGVEIAPQVDLSPRPA